MKKYNDDVISGAIVIVGLFSLALSVFILFKYGFLVALGYLGILIGINSAVFVLKCILNGPRLFGIISGVIYVSIFLYGLSHHLKLFGGLYNGFYTAAILVSLLGILLVILDFALTAGTDLYDFHLNLLVTSVVVILAMFFIITGTTRYKVSTMMFEKIPTKTVTQYYEKNQSTLSFSDVLISALDDMKAQGLHDFDSRDLNRIIQSKDDIKYAKKVVSSTLYSKQHEGYLEITMYQTAEYKFTKIDRYETAVFLVRMSDLKVFDTNMKPLN